jgi:hypothetical protein
MIPKFLPNVALRTWSVGSVSESFIHYLEKLGLGYIGIGSNSEQKPESLCIQIIHLKIFGDEMESI